MSLGDGCIGQIDRYFIIPPSLTACSSAAIWPTETYNSSIKTLHKDLNLLKNIIPAQETKSNFITDFALSNDPVFIKLI